jgi:gamma-glutamyl:cysteine ligase YbdK (ATP-grasp superfamily)
VLLHNAIACVLPYLPALAASSPIVEGRPGAAICNRMAFYATNQNRVPQIAGRIVPEFMTSFEQYDRDVFQPIYRALEAIEGTERIRHEFVNSRGAIPRFDRSAMEIRVLDLQECVKMDVAIAVFARLATKRFAKLLQDRAVRLPEHASLVEDFEACVRQGRAAAVHATHLAAATGYRPGAATAETALLELLDLAYDASEPADRPYLAAVEERIRRGSLAECILRQAGFDRRSEAEAQATLHVIYRELAGCLERNEPWVG